jgi:DNA-binding HxlR family transcriptional regulator
MERETKTTNPETCVLSQNSPLRQALSVIADKWTVLIIYALGEESKRFGELQRDIEGISQKMLIQTLRNLQRDGLIARKVYPVVPPKVEYSLTSLGMSLKQVTLPLCQWAEVNLGELESARFQYDKSVD